jgi:hypothetical protein
MKIGQFIQEGLGEEKRATQFAFIISILLFVEGTDIGSSIQ